MLEEILENLKQKQEYDCYQINNKIYTNRELYRYICNIYEYLLENNKQNKSVIVKGHKDIYMIAAFLACAFAGITYVPIDISIPQERQNKIIEQIQPQLIIDEKIKEIMDKPCHNEIEKIYMNLEDTYYIIFTSGTTGEPKGVKIAYRNLQSCVNWLKDVCNISNSIILNQANYSFDLSIADMYLSLITKSKHYILEREKQKNYIDLFQEIINSEAEMAVMTPSMADMLLLDRSFNKENIKKLRKILFCGEKLTKKTVEKLYDRFPEIDIINSYGPTECTFAVTSINLSKGNIEENISIGIPKKDTNIYIVDENLKEVKNGELGEILIQGESVGQGYVKSNMGFLRYDDKPAYLTGDIGYIKNGQIYFIGRKDNQIKYKGYRIEISEIENVLNKYNNAEKVVVVPTKNEYGKVNKIIAFIKLAKQDENAVNQLEEIAKKQLPEYMFPIIKIIEDIPLNQNGKVDKKQLMEEYFK